MTRPVPVDHLDRLLDRAEKRDIRYFLDENEKSRQMKQQRSEQADKWIDEFEDQEFNEFIEERKKSHRAEAERKKEEQQTEIDRRYIQEIVDTGIKQYENGQVNTMEQVEEKLKQWH